MLTTCKNLEISIAPLHNWGNRKHCSIGLHTGSATLDCSFNKNPTEISAMCKVSTVSTVWTVRSTFSLSAPSISFSSEPSPTFLKSSGSIWNFRISKMQLWQERSFLCVFQKHLQFPDRLQDCNSFGLSSWAFGFFCFSRWRNLRQTSISQGPGLSTQSLIFSVSSWLMKCYASLIQVWPWTGTAHWILGLTNCKVFDCTASPTAARPNALSA